MLSHTMGQSSMLSVFSGLRTRLARRSARRSWVVEVVDEIAGLEAEWQALATPENSTPFQRFGLVSAFYAQLARNGLARPVIALVRNRDGRSVAIFPMTLSRRAGLNWLQMADGTVTDYCAPILAPDLGAEEVRAIADQVLRAVPGADLLYCNKMPAHFMGRANPMIDLPNAARLRSSAWTLDIAGLTREEVLAKQSERFRGNLKRVTRKFGQAYRSGFSLAVGADIRAEDFAAFQELRRDSASRKERRNVLDDPLWTEFYLGIVASKRPDCQPWLSTLSADGRVVATLFGFTDGVRPVAIMPAALGGDWNGYALGLQLFEQTILAFRDKGMPIFDISIGDSPYKRRFGCDRLALYDALFARGLLGRLYALFWRAKVAYRQRFLLPEGAGEP